ncbi:hypothetical protein L2E82_32089 [Cichorium intybus]|uniref:Uncharacterized protein n=1 Tax=Cichorium intybus TaxID=13427 RepID=A0ACB9BFV2_CICIN|nr:hypothetical protein L2E82_32089 [Cichorium intybus]
MEMFVTPPPDHLNMLVLRLTPLAPLLPLPLTPSNFKIYNITHYRKPSSSLILSADKFSPTLKRQSPAKNQHTPDSTTASRRLRLPASSRRLYCFTSCLHVAASSRASGRHRSLGRTAAVVAQHQIVTHRAAIAFQIKRAAL